jgi:RNA polymerase sigma-70 factor (ECF subfamily)
VTQNPGDRLLEQHAFVQRLALALLKDRDLAADVAQDAMVAAIERPPAVATPMHLRAWLRTVVRRIALAARTDRAERALRERRVARPEGDDAERAASEQLALHRDLTAAVHALPEPYRTAVTLRYLADRTPTAIAQQSGVTSDVVRQRLHRGLAMLRARLDREHGSRAAWAGPLAALLPEPSFFVLLASLAMTKHVLAAAAALAVCVTGTWLALRTETPVALPIAAADTATLASAGIERRNATPTDAGAATPKAPAAAEVRTSADFVIAVVDEHEAPVTDAEVHCLAADAEPQRRTTTATGRVSFPARDSRGSIVVRVRARPPILRLFETLRGEQRVVLEDGLRVAGQVLVDGAPAPAGLRLRLATRRDDVEALPSVFAELLTADATTTTDGDGRFAFAGLEATWRGSLELPLQDTHWLLPRPGQQQRDHVHLLLPQPVDDLVVATTALPSLRAQVVWDDDGSPVAGADVTAYAAFAVDDGSPMISLDTDAEGRFAVGFPDGDASLYPERRRPVLRASLRVRAQGSERDFELPGPLPAQAVTLRLPRGTVTVFRATDRSGLPIAGALAASRGLSEPTDRAGIGRFSGPRDTALVGAPGFLIVPCPAGTAAGTADDPLPVVLDRRNELRIRAVDGNGNRSPFDRLEVDIDGTCFSGRPGPTELHYAFGGTRLGAATLGKAPHCMFTLDEHGEVLLHSLDVGRTLQLCLRDALGAVVAQHTVAVPAVGVTATIPLDVTAVERPVRGTVCASGGAPLADADIAVAGESSAWHRCCATSAADGTFTCRGISATGPLTVAAQRLGYAMQQRSLAAGETSLAFVLEPSRQVALRVVDEQGALVPLDRIDVRGAVGGWRKTSPGPGEFVFADLPQQGITFAVQLGSREFSCTPDAGATAAELRVPVLARVAFGPLPAGFSPPGHGFFEVLAQMQAPPGEPFRLGLGADAQPALLPPGRYRFVLLRCEYDDLQKDYVPSELPAAAEVDLVAGATTTVALR